jgi:hypothetical protein
MLNHWKRFIVGIRGKLIGNMEIFALSVASRIFLEFREYMYASNFQTDQVKSSAGWSRFIAGQQKIAQQVGCSENLIFRGERAENLDFCGNSSHLSWQSRL